MTSHRPATPALPMESTFPFLASQSSSPAAFPASCWGFLLPFPHSGHFLPDRGTWTWAGECGYGTAAAAPRTLHSLKLTPTPGPKDHSTDLTYWMNLEGFQVTMERAIQLNISCECGEVAESLRAVVCVCVCARMCREKASLLVYGSAPWELRWGVAVKDSTPPHFLVSLLGCWSVSIPLLPLQQAHVFLPQMLRGTSTSASPSETSQVGPDLSSPGLSPAPGTASKVGKGSGLECDQRWEEQGENHHPAPPPMH